MQDDLFSIGEPEIKNVGTPQTYTHPKVKPIPHKQEGFNTKYRPEKIKDVLGNTQTKALFELMLNTKIQSIIIHGSPGTGKTSIAWALAQEVNGMFIKASAAVQKTDDIKKYIKQAQINTSKGIKTFLFLDEIHRFNKTQQDVLLPHVENEDIILIGATTENPYFSINAALISRCIVTKSTLPDVKELKNHLVEICTMEGLQFEEPSLDYIIARSNGDIRKSMQLLELCKTILYDKGIVADMIPEGYTQHDKVSDHHYDILSAFIKSIRGSDMEAAFYWMSRLQKGGEDPRAIARRIIVHASEDIGLADPHALPIATAAAEAVEKVGAPECYINLAHAVAYMCTCSKSNTSHKGYQIYKEIKKDIEVPPYLRDTHYASAAKLGNTGYLNPHVCDYKEIQDYLGVANKIRIPLPLADYGDEARLKEAVQLRKSIT